MLRATGCNIPVPLQHQGWRHAQAHCPPEAVAIPKLVSLSEHFLEDHTCIILFLYLATYTYI
jgi:hypothetical protein